MRNIEHLKNPKWPPGGPKMADGVWKRFLPSVIGHFGAPLPPICGLGGHFGFCWWSYVSHRRSARIKKLIYQKLTGAPINAFQTLSAILGPLAAILDFAVDAALQAEIE